VRHRSLSWPAEATPILLEGLKRLEYRGYDSAGIAIIRDGKLHIRRAVGRISVLEEKVGGQLDGATIGMAHTRWATHGAPTEANAHRTATQRQARPRAQRNHRKLPRFADVPRDGTASRLESQTDTEVLAKLVGYFYDGSLDEAVRQALREVRGTFGITVLHTDEPETIVAARRGSPLIIGVGKEEYLVASDAAAIIQHTPQVIYLSDNEVVTITRQGFRTTTAGGAGDEGGRGGRVAAGAARAGRAPALHEQGDFRSSRKRCGPACAGGLIWKRGASCWAGSKA